MTAQELLAIAREGRPNVRYAATKQGNAIGGWSAEHGRFVVVASLAIDQSWYSVPYELQINGQPPYRADDWIE